MNQIVAIAMGGAFGALFRFLLSGAVYQWLGRGFPFGTLAVNVIGSFLMGLLFETLSDRLALSPELRAAITVGLLGAFTTFSTFSIETLYLIEEGELLKAGGNILVSVILCLVAVWIGLLAGRQL
jgi:CrcB protein